MSRSSSDLSFFCSVGFPCTPLIIIIFMMFYALCLELRIYASHLMFRRRAEERRGEGGLVLQDDDDGSWGLRYNNLKQGHEAPGVSVVGQQQDESAGKAR